MSSLIQGFWTWQTWVPPRSNTWSWLLFDQFASRNPVVTGLYCHWWYATSSLSTKGSTLVERVSWWHTTEWDYTINQSRLSLDATLFFHSWKCVMKPTSVLEGRIQKYSCFCMSYGLKITLMLLNLGLHNNDARLKCNWVTHSLSFG